MSSYLTTINGELVFNSEDADKIREVIQKEAGKSSWNNYGWADTIRNAEDICEILDEFDIEYKDAGNGWISCELNDTYNSAFLSTMLDCCAEFLDDGEMEVKNTDYDEVAIITIKNGKAEVIWQEGE